MKNRFENGDEPAVIETEPASQPDARNVETQPERELTERQLSSEEVTEFKGELDKYVSGLQTRIGELQAEREALRQMSPQADEFARMREIETELVELQGQLDGLQDSSEAIAEAGDAAAITVKE